MFKFSFFKNELKNFYINIPTIKVNKPTYAR